MKSLVVLVLAFVALPAFAQDDVELDASKYVRAGFRSVDLDAAADSYNDMISRMEDSIEKARRTRLNTRLTRISNPEKMVDGFAVGLRPSRRADITIIKDQSAIKKGFFLGIQGEDWEFVFRSNDQRKAFIEHQEKKIDEMRELSQKPYSYNKPSGWTEAMYFRMNEGEVAELHLQAVRIVDVMGEFKVTEEVDQILDSLGLEIRKGDGEQYRKFQAKVRGKGCSWLLCSTKRLGDVEPFVLIVNNKYGFLPDGVVNVKGAFKHGGTYTYSATTGVKRTVPIIEQIEDKESEAVFDKELDKQIKAASSK